MMNNLFWIGYVFPMIVFILSFSLWLANYHAQHDHIYVFHLMWYLVAFIPGFNILMAMAWLIEIFDFINFLEGILFRKILK